MARETVNNYDCCRYKVQIQAQVRSKKKLTQEFEHNYDAYFAGAETFSLETKQLAHDLCLKPLDIFPLVLIIYYYLKLVRMFYKDGKNDHIGQ